MKIGYQGEVGSNAEEAAKRMSAQLALKKVEYVPLVTSKAVVEKLMSREIDFGVAAAFNTLGGIVSETAEAIKEVSIKIGAKQTITIHHCLFKKNENIEDQALKKVASHIQALKQTRLTRNKLYPYLEEQAIEDTAIGARWLSEGKLPETTAVICRKNAGQLYHLALVKENIEDAKDDQTTFILFRLGDL